MNERTPDQKSTRTKNKKNKPNKGIKPRQWLNRGLKGSRLRSRNPKPSNHPRPAALSKIQRTPSKNYSKMKAWCSYGKISLSC